eukprot:1160864-Pelagomonas_calceolata.AAC.1
MSKADCTACSELPPNPAVPNPINGMSTPLFSLACTVRNEVNSQWMEIALPMTPFFNAVADDP